MNKAVFRRLRAILPLVFFWSIIVGVSWYAFRQWREPPVTRPLAYDEFQKGWQPTRASFATADGRPLYDMARANYGALTVDLRAADREGDQEVWFRTEVPSRTELSSAFLEKLQSISGFEPNLWALYWSWVFQLRNLLAFFGVLLSIGMHQQAREAKGTNPLAPILVASIFLWWSYLIHTGGLPKDLFATWRDQLFEQGFIPYAILWGFFYGLACLLQVRGAYGNPYGDVQEVNELLDSLRVLYERDGDIAAVQRLRDEKLESKERTIHLAFTAVRYTEMILPVLGFIGTVVGLGVALTQMQDAIVFKQGEGYSLNPGKLREMFAGMALAFYTTLFGFLGLIFVGFFHIVLRKRIESRLNQVAIYLTNMLAAYKNEPSKVEVVAIPAQDGILRTAAAVEQASELFLRCVHEDPALYDRFGPILFEQSVISSAEYEGMARRILQEINERAGTPRWEIEALSVPPGRGGVCGALVTIPGEERSLLCRFELVSDDAPRHGRVNVVPFNRTADWLVMCNDDSALLRVTTDAGPQLFWWRQGNLAGSPAFYDPVLDHELVLPVPAGTGQDGAVLVHGATNKRLLTFLPAQSGAPATLLAGAVPNGMWTLAAVSPDARALVLGGHQPPDHHAKLLVYHAGVQEGRWELNDNPDELPQLADVTDLEQVEWLSPRELLLVRGNGDLLTLDINRGGNPGTLTHAGWHRVAGTSVIVGPNRWIAVLRGNRLSMWRITLGGGLVPSPRRESFLVAGIIRSRLALADSLVGPKQGQRGPACLVGAVEQLVTVWNFPQQSPAVKSRQDTAGAPESEDAHA